MQGHQAAGFVDEIHQSCSLLSIVKQLFRCLISRRLQRLASICCGLYSLRLQSPQQINLLRTTEGSKKF